MPNRICEQCSGISKDLIFYTNTSSYLCGGCLDQHFSANYCDCCSKEETNLAYSKVMRGSVCEKCELILETGE